ncbi:hypothetical protein TSOC_004035 [Tetrabaena socialis]|uniref:Uncharacterized protein n=1 Tax=Tetrabaena socialis TaxID=47790 RepID=A0A2J8A9Y7_9CHLO|nr:hypothetical protein TSOC_004035 [Tetrabaena socialis]|eukprot:PNH09344.1 hypothetical protein TSOC_004035 [Tetrabaena socialis]
MEPDRGRAAHIGAMGARAQRPAPGSWLLLALLAAAACVCSSEDPAVGGLPGGLPVGGVPRTGRRGRPHHYAFFSEKAPCAVLQRSYVPSPLETKWVEAAAAWKAAGNGDVHDMTPYCSLLVETLPAIQRMLALVSQLMAGNSTLSDAADADSVLSHFVVTLQCGPYELVVKEHIESLVAALRHPFAIDCPAGSSAAAALPPKADLFDKGYVLLASWAGQDCCWKSTVDSRSQLSDSMAMFQQLRALGIRSHYWQ